MLTCVIEALSLHYLTWISSDYIAPDDGYFTFIITTRESALGLGLRSGPYDTTFARITYYDANHQPARVASNLRLTTRADVLSSNVSCVHDDGDRDNFTLRLLGIYTYPIWYE